MYVGEVAVPHDKLIFGKWYFRPAQFETSDSIEAGQFCLLDRLLNLSRNTVTNAISILAVCGLDVRG
jgi:hypothetical protein